MITLKDLDYIEYSDFVSINTKERLYTGWVSDIKVRSHFPDIIEIKLAEYYTGETILIPLNDIIWISFTEEDLDLGI